MSNTSPPAEAQRFGRSQTPESPRPVHIPEPANIPVLLNQMDPVFNDTATYNIPHNQTFSPFPDPLSEQGVQSAGVDEHDAVQNFFREAEHQAAAEPEPSVKTIQNAMNAASQVPVEANSIPTIPSSENLAGQQEQDPNALLLQTMQTALSDGVAAGSMAISNAHAQPEEHTSAGQVVVETELDHAYDSVQQDLFSNTNIEGGVDYQSLLDTISQSASTAPAVSGIAAPTTATSHLEDLSRPLPSIPGLPPKPPPQEHPIEFPSYSSYDNSVAQGPNLGIGLKDASIENVQGGGASRQTGLPDLTSSQHATAQSYPPMPNFNAFNPASPTKSAQLPPVPEQVAPGQEVNKSLDPGERPWSPRTQSLYDQFLEDERRYVTEGIWDKFPNGSRLFVGNLPSERVTKRDLFHKFHKHGQLAQISIKQAYGFVQFLEAASCLAALNAEQGVEIRGRKVHLEISKPQKNTRGAGGGAGGGGSGGGGGGGNNKNQQRRRSRSPDRGSRRENRNYSDYRDEPARRRDEYRNRRSPSPRGYRARDDFRSGGRDGRSRSPFYGNNFAPSQTAAADDEASLTLPRRDPRQVPDVQLLVLEPEVVQSFINWVEQGFRNKGLQASTIWVNNRFPLPAVIKRQIIEGVQAVVKLTRNAQSNSKIPLQVFDRSAGASNVNFSEYVDLDVSIAADVVLQARQKERGGYAAPAYPSQNYQPPPQYGTPQPPIPYPQQIAPQYTQQQSPQAAQYAYLNPQTNNYRPGTQPPTPTGQPPNLQQLLANLRQPHAHANAQNIAATSQNGQPTNFAGFLGNVGTPQQYSQAQPAPYGQYNAGPPQQGAQQPNVQNIMEQLARYNR